jgi:hypothetical protein
MGWDVGYGSSDISSIIIQPDNILDTPFSGETQEFHPLRQLHSVVYSYTRGKDVS